MVKDSLEYTLAMQEDPIHHLREISFEMLVFMVLLLLGCVIIP